MIYTAGNNVIKQESADLIKFQWYTLNLIVQVRCDTYIANCI